MEKEGYFYWFPKNTWGQRDVFGVYDFIAVKRNTTMFVQVTTLSNVSHRYKKINAFFNDWDVDVANSFIWAWDKKADKFKIIRVKRSGGQSGRFPERIPTSTGGPSTSERVTLEDIIKKE